MISPSSLRISSNPYAIIGFRPLAKRNLPIALRNSCTWTSFLSLQAPEGGLNHDGAISTHSLILSTSSSCLHNDIISQLTCATKAPLSWILKALPEGRQEMMVSNPSVSASSKRSCSAKGNRGVSSCIEPIESFLVRLVGGVSSGGAVVVDGLLVRIVVLVA
jgi:hypothetical protein